MECGMVVVVNNIDLMEIKHYFKGTVECYNYNWEYD
jgi:hypothetical protein